MPNTVFITGASRGIGLAFCRQYLEDGATVFAACRAPQDAGGLQLLCREFRDTLIPVALDVTVESSIADAVRSVHCYTEALDLLISNAAYPADRGERIGNLRPQAMMTAMQVNAVGPLVVVKHLLPLLRQSKQPRIAVVSSEAGSIQGANAFGGVYSYNAAKAALNMLCRLLSHELRPLAVPVLILHPGWVRTKETNAMAPLSPEESVQAMTGLIAQLSLESTGRFVTYQGEEYPW